MDHLALTSFVGQRCVAGLVWCRTHQTASGTFSQMNRDSSVDIVTGYGLDGRRVSKVKISLLQAMEAHRVARG
jgi:hypothetical protein